jgi:hypothetical protein
MSFVSPVEFGCGVETLQQKVRAVRPWRRLSD